jgi:hypothetical protein
LKAMESLRWPGLTSARLHDKFPPRSSGLQECYMAVKRERPHAFLPGERTASRTKARSTPGRVPAGESTLALGSGRTLHLRSRNSGETIEVRSAGNEVEVSIMLGPGGPVVSVRGAQELEVAAPRVAVRCDVFELDAGERLRLSSQGDMKLKARGDVLVNGALVKLNCDEGEAP